MNVHKDSFAILKQEILGLLTYNLYHKFNGLVYNALSFIQPNYLYHLLLFS